MKSFGLFKHKKAIILTLLTALIFSMAGISAPLLKSAVAKESENSVSLTLPSTNLEYRALYSPIDVYHDESVTAIVHNGQLLVYQNGNYQAPITNFTSIKQVKKLDKDTLLVSDNGSIYTIPLNNLSSKTAIKDNNSNIIGGNYFDVNDKYIVSAYGTDGTIYRKATNAYVYVDKFTLDGDKPIAINENDDVYYVNDGIYTINASKPKEQPIKLSNAVPSKMIADAQNVYYLLSGESKVYKLSLSDLSVTELSANAENYNLGNLISPSGLSFNGENILLTDTTLNAVQEFKVSDSEIDFTGFAIASGKTAYNRIGDSAVDTEKYGDTVAVLDEYKLTVINNSSTEKYAKENYNNYILGLDIDENVQYFALGKDKILYSTTSTDIKFINLNDKESELLPVNLPISGALVDDITYQSGTFYLLIHNSTSSIVYAIQESDESVSVKELLRQSSSTNFGDIAVDVFKNLFISDENGVYKYSLDNNLYKKVATTSITGVNKLTTDLGGKLYALSNGTIKVYDGSSVKDVTPAPYISGDTIKSFAMNFDKSEVNIIYANREYIISSLALENYALDKASVTNDIFATTGKNASVDNLKFATVKDGANVYSVERKDLGFTFKGLVSAEEKYVYICDVTLSDKLTLCALVGNDGLALIDKTQLTIENATIQSAPEKVFVTTNVNAYFYPLITKNAEYSLTDGNTIRIAKFTEISPISKVNALGKDFYFASINSNGKTYKGFVPVDFTTTILSEDYKWDNHTIEVVKAATVYIDADLTQELLTLSDNTEIKVLSTQNGVAKILLKIDGKTVEGYILEDAIKTPERRAIINVIVIFTVTACLAGSALYFTLKRKQK